MFSLVFIYVLSVVPVEALPPTNDKLNHIAAFFYLSVVGGVCLNRLKLFLLLFFYGIFIEFTQLFVPGRYCDWRDVVADVAGILLGLVAVFVLEGVRGKSKT